MANKPLIPLTEAQQNRLAKIIFNVLVSGNINRLTQGAYKFLYLSYGFIAHYNFYGFKYHYQDTSDLLKNLVRNRRMLVVTNYRPGERDYEYYKSKADVHAKLFRMLEDAKMVEPYFQVI